MIVFRFRQKYSYNITGTLQWVQMFHKCPNVVLTHVWEIMFVLRAGLCPSNSM